MIGLRLKLIKRRVTCFSVSGAGDDILLILKYINVILVISETRKDLSTQFLTNKKEAMFFLILEVESDILLIKDAKCTILSILKAKSRFCRF